MGKGGGDDEEERGGWGRNGEMRKDDDGHWEDIVGRWVEKMVDGI